ncbi:MAG: alpha-ribazole phosphatase [Bacteroidales bacterium]|jgi:alpha-ribazole phosphatase
MQIYLIRHTKVDVPKDIFYGQTDVPLFETFDDEVKEISIKLKGIIPDAVYSSPLSRCRLLAEKITDENIIKYDNRLMELNFGDWEMKSWNQINKIDSKNWYDDFINTSCPNGESYCDLYNRIHLFYNEISKIDCKNIFVFTHSGVIRAFMAIVNEIDLKESFREEIPYGCVISFKK